MKVLILAALLAGSAHARIYSPSLSCAEARNLVARSGAVILYTSPYTYDRYVAHQGYCSNAGDEIARPAFVPTADHPRCFVGYTCDQDNRDH